MTIKQKMSINALWVIIILNFYSLSFADPSITNILGLLAHKNSVTIQGTGFGTKSPAAPLLWDDGEDNTIDSDAAMSAVYDEVSNGSVPSFARLRYRLASTFTGNDHTAGYVSPPHPYSTKYIAGAFYQYDGNSPQYSMCCDDIHFGVIIYPETTDIWYFSAYHRYDPYWADPQTGSSIINDKILSKGGGDHIWDIPQAYDSFRTAPATTENGVRVLISNNTGACTRKYDTSPFEPYVNNPKNDWVKVEHLHWSDGSHGMRDFYFDNEHAAGYEDGCSNWLNNTAWFGIGIYYRDDINHSNQPRDFRGCKDCYKYYDDVYIDTTWSRVVLANNSNYERATIVEPQIPSAWNTNEIAVSINLGRLSNLGAVYLFVFDANNNHNQMGYPVATTANVPWPPENLKVLN